MESAVILLGGYGSWGHILAISFCLLGGAILAKRAHPLFALIGCSLEIIGAIVILDWISHAVATTPSASAWLQAVPWLFVSAIIVGAVYGLRKGWKKGTDRTDE